MRRHEVDVVVAEPDEERSGDELERRPLVSRAHRRQREELVTAREVRWRRAAVAVDLGGDGRRRQPDPPDGEGPVEELAHRRKLLGGGGAFGSGPAHRGAAQRGVADHEADVRTERPRRHDVEELGKRLAR